MNKLEARFALQLEAHRRNGEIDSYEFEGVTLKIGDDCRYTPDFFVVDNDGWIIFYETKGYFRDDAKAKIRSAAKQYPYFRFVLVTEDKATKLLIHKEYTWS